MDSLNQSKNMFIQPKIGLTIRVNDPSFNPDCTDDEFPDLLRQATLMMSLLDIYEDEPEHESEHELPCLYDDYFEYKCQSNHRMKNVGKSEGTNEYRDMKREKEARSKKKTHRSRTHSKCTWI